jgi:hypothetical protein
MGDSADAPNRLLDGASAREMSVELDGVEGPTVLTSAALLEVKSIEAGSQAAACLNRPLQPAAQGSAVIRVGVMSESVTAREAGRAAVFGCNDSPGAREDSRRWCGGGYGTLTAGRLTDPRLDIICTTDEGEQVGFAWVEPGNGTRYLAVEQPEYTEVYEPAGDLPVRIFTLSGVDLETASATFDVSEHDAEGRRLREYELKAVVAG